MELKSLHIQFIETGKTDTPAPLRHVKTLPYLSIAFPVRGKYLFALGGNTPQEIAEGSCFIAPPDVVQTITHLRDENGGMDFHWLFFNAVVNDRTFIDEMYEFPNVLHGEEAKRAIETVYEIDALPADTMQGVIKRNVAALDLLSFLVSIAKEKTALPYSVQPALNFIKLNYHTKIDMDHLAKLCNMSRTAFYTHFKERCNISPLEMTIHYRLQSSLYLLRQDVSIDHIAEECGFFDRYHYSKTFKKTYGITPVEYKKIISAQK